MAWCDFRAVLDGAAKLGEPGESSICGIGLVLVGRHSSPRACALVDVASDFEAGGLKLFHQLWLPSLVLIHWDIQHALDI